MKTIFANSTRGGKYEVRLQITGSDDVFPGTYQVCELVNGRQDAFANLGQIGAQRATAEYNKRIELAARYDGVFYTRDLRALLGAL
jgi:hypothetical protein